MLASGEHAQERGDQSATVGLLTRASELLPAAHSDRPRATLELATALFDLGEFDRGAAAIADAEAIAGAAGDKAVLARSRLARIELQIQRDRTVTMADALAAARAALAELEEIGDEEGTVWALRLVGNFTEWLGASGEAEAYWRRALERADSTRSRQRTTCSAGCCSLRGGARSRWERCCGLRRGGGRAPSKRLEAHALITRGAARAVVGELEDGRRDIAAGRGLLLDLGHRIAWAGLSAIEAEMELVSGDAARAYEVVAKGREALEASAETGYLSTVVGYVAQAALELGRDDEAMRSAEETRGLAAPDDFEPLAREGLVRARVPARRGDFAGADELIASTVELVNPTDWLMLRRDVARARAAVAGLAGRPDEQREALEQAFSLAEAKGSVVAAGRDREALAAMRT